MDKLTKVTVNGNTYQLGVDFDESKFYKTSITLASAPDTTTKSYQGYTLPIGAVVRVADANSTTGYKFYRLHDITSGGDAIWSELDMGSVTLPETVTVHIATNQASTADLINNVTIIVDGVSKTYTGTDLVFYVDEDTQYTITSNTPDGYYVSNDSTGTYTAEFWGSREATITYNTTVLTVSVTKENAGTVSNPTLTLKVNGSSIANPTFPYNVPTGASYEVGVTDSIEGYKTPNAVNGTATDSSYEVEFEYKEFHPGVWAYYSDGSLKSYDDADNNAIGVAVITENAQFVIGKSYTTAAFGGYYKDTSTINVVCTEDSSVAITDFAGESNTTKIIADFDGYYNLLISGSPAATWCRLQFDGAGYLGSAGEWIELKNNRAAVLLMFSKIGSPSIAYGRSYWVSTLRNSTEAWLYSYNQDNITYDYRLKDYYFVVAFKHI